MVWDLPEEETVVCQGLARGCLVPSVEDTSQGHGWKNKKKGGLEAEVQPGGGVGGPSSGPGAGKLPQEAQTGHWGMRSERSNFAFCVKVGDGAKKPCAFCSNSEPSLASSCQHDQALNP